ncbi:unnamed protein product [Fraxinus pennsylvanica]|uniref:PGG domain-containing protein n=1 Tax=Fraxinus pennsylvanica TaxID=56036 RepID=A0AAD2A0X5_9LAMI|nr:unnamed protein product [Fraxinus pennsylvanica]
MDPSLYKAVQEGNLNAMREKRELISATQLTPNKNTLLHVAAQFNNSGECASAILKINGSLFHEVNSDQETVLHVATRNRKGNVGEVIMEFAKGLDRDQLEAGGIGEELKWLLTSKNIHGDTALHEAIRKNRPSMVNSMIKEDPEIANIANNAMETPLFLAVASARVDENLSTCMDYIMKYCPSPAYSGPEGRTALHAVALYNKKGISKKLLEKHPTIIKEVDDFGWSALHYAALHGSNEVAEELLEADRSIAYTVVENDNNKTALHIATCEGNVNIMKEILAYCPDCWEKVTRDGRNILHLSVKLKKQQAFKFIMKKSWAGNLINQKDAEGNTPLHVYAATPNFHGCDLVNHPLAEKNAVNNKNMTPLDVITSSYFYSLRQYDVMKELIQRGANLDTWNVAIRENSLMQKMEARPEDGDEVVKTDTRRVADTHMLMATLITTVAFAAGFTVPGGYDGKDGPNEGLAVLSRKAAFKAFIISDTLAMICSACAICLHFDGVLITDKSKLRQLCTVAAMFISLATEAMPQLCYFTLLQDKKYI